MTRAPRFRHGVHPPDSKTLTEGLPVRRMPYPAEVVLPLQQHAGRPAKLVVELDQRVERGDVLAEADGHVSVPIHASASGTVVDVGLSPHPSGAWEPAVRIAVDADSAQAARPRLVPHWEQLSPEQIVQAVKDAGVVGLGGAAFPTHVKLAPPPGTRLEALLVNGCECEPYLTTDHRTMVDHPERVQLGVRILMRCLGVERAMIGVERNKPDAIEALQATLPDDLDVTVLPLTVKYPQGAEKMLIKAVTGREVPSGKLPLDAGVLVQNVASLATIAEVFETGLPLVERVVTVTGGGIVEPKNLLVPIGTKLRDLFAACGGTTFDAKQIVMGGPMMGPSQSNLDTPIVKGVTGVVVLQGADVKPQETFDCIKCGHCLDACPIFLNPQRLGLLAKNTRYEDMQEDYHLNDCMLCGCCSYVCPSNIPLSHLFGASKAALRSRS